MGCTLKVVHHAELCMYTKLNAYFPCGNGSRVRMLNLLIMTPPIVDCGPSFASLTHFTSSDFEHTVLEIWPNLSQNNNNYTNEYNGAPTYFVGPLKSVHGDGVLAR